MKTSLRKLRGLALHRHGDGRDRRDGHFQQPLAQLDELAQATQDMQDMRDCYESLFSAAAATANSAYEFSESLREMGSCLLEKTALNDDEESGRVLIMLGKLQFELQKLVDNYRSHIFKTISIPSESLLNELRIVEEMKRQCDDKRELYEHMVTRHREKGRLRSSKGESYSSQQLQAARDEYDEDATLFVFRLKSLKRGQSRSLLTQAARHHAAQLCYFRKGLKSLEVVEPHVKLISEQQHIEYQFSGLEDDDGDGGDNNDHDDSDDDDGYDTHDDGELSFDYGQNDSDQDVSTSRNSMELDHVDLTFPHVAKVDAPKENFYRNLGGNTFAFGRDLKINSQSAPLFAEKKFDPAERFRQMRQSSTRKSHSYVLPTPVETKSAMSTESDTPEPQTSRTSLSRGSRNLWHSSPLEQKNYEKIVRNEKLSGPIVLNRQSVLKESNNNTTSTRLPLPLAEGLSLPNLDLNVTSDAKKVKRQAFSGPLSSKPWSKKAFLYASGPIASTPHPRMFSGPLLRTPLPHPSSSPKVSPNTSPTFVSSPKISELHALPRPPANLTSTSASRPSNFLAGYSGPLVSKGQELSATNKMVAFSAASPLPRPPLTLPRSHSIPSGGQRVTLLSGSKPLEEPDKLKLAQDIASPPFAPISLSNFQSASSASETVIPSDQTRGAD